MSEIDVQGKVQGERWSGFVELSSDYFLHRTSSLGANRLDTSRLVFTGRIRVIVLGLWVGLIFRVTLSRCMAGQLWGGMDHTTQPQWLG